MELHGAIGGGDTASFVGGEVVGYGSARAVVEVDERVADTVPERVVDGATALMPDGAFVEGDRVCGGGSAPGKEETEWKEEREEEGLEEGGDYGE